MDSIGLYYVTVLTRYPDRSLDDTGMPRHLAMAVNAKREGPLGESELRDAVHVVCWCGDEGCDKFRVTRPGHGRTCQILQGCGHDCQRPPSYAHWGRQGWRIFQLRACEMHRKEYRRLLRSFPPVWGMRWLSKPGVLPQ